MRLSKYLKLGAFYSYLVFIYAATQAVGLLIFSYKASSELAPGEGAGSASVESPNSVLPRGEKGLMVLVSGLQISSFAFPCL